jgi:hypothetical protein
LLEPAVVPPRGEVGRFRRNFLTGRNLRCGRNVSGRRYFRRRRNLPVGRYLSGGRDLRWRGLLARVLFCGRHLGCGRAGQHLDDEE